MPKFNIGFERAYTVTEGFHRVIEAPSREAALAYAEDLCDQFNSDCPDDCGELGGGEAAAFTAGGFLGQDVLPVEDSVLADFRIDEDGEGEEIDYSTPAPEAVEKAAEV